MVLIGCVCDDGKPRTFYLYGTSEDLCIPDRSRFVVIFRCCPQTAQSSLYCCTVEWPIRLRLLGVAAVVVVAPLVVVVAPLFEETLFQRSVAKLD